MNTKGKFIVFEGIDGAGKTTQVELLKKRLTDMGREVFLTAEPTDLPMGREIRRVLTGELKKNEYEIAAMFALDRIDHNTNAECGIRMLTERGTDVISDRYYYSSLAYQGYATSYEWVRAMNTDCPAIRRPDICIYLDLTPEESLARIVERHGKVEIYENIEKLTRVRETFLSMIEERRAAGERMFPVSAARTPEEISDEIFNIVYQNLFT